MTTMKLRILTLAGLAVTALAASAPSFARGYDDHSRYVRYERDYRDDHRYRYSQNRPRFDRRRDVVVARPVYIDRRPVVVERRVYVEQPVYNQQPQGSLGEIIGGAIGAYIEERATDGR
jgi:hypothetical protein